MSYATIMVHVEIGRKNPGLLRIAADLAERFDARVIGIAACQPMQIVYGDGYVSGDFVQEDRAELEKEIKAAEAEFRSAFDSRAAKLEWRAAITFLSLSQYLAHEARGADLLITGLDRNRSAFDSSRHVNTDDLVMQIGRPVLLLPLAATQLTLGHILVGWKDTRETRRAVSDALPLLKQATHVSVVEIAAESELAIARLHLKDVVVWLERHGIVAEAIAAPSTGDDAGRLNAIAEEQGADILVAGAYGHSRLREWVLGGVSRDLLLHADRCSLLSH